MDHDDHDLPADLRDVARRVRAEHPAASSLELDSLRQRIQRCGARPARSRRTFMKSRMMMTAMLTLGVLMSTTGAGLAVTGLAGSGSASQAQYPDNREGCGNSGSALGDVGSGGSGGDVGSGGSGGGAGSGGGSGDPGDPGTLGSASGCDPVSADPRDPVSADSSDPEATVQESRQLAAAGDDELPFTGFVAVPVLVGGVALMGTGLVLRRRSQD